MGKVNRYGQATVLNQAQLQNLWSNLDQPYRLITQILYFTASRIGEVRVLKPENFVADRLVIRQQKTQTTKTIKLAQPLREYIKEFQFPEESDHYLFPSPTDASKPITRQSIDYALRSTCKSLKLQGVSTHSFRRSLATHLYLAGYNIRAIMSITGHKSMDAFQKYIDVQNYEADEAIDTFFKPQGPPALLVNRMRR